MQAKTLFGRFGRMLSVAILLFLIYGCAAPQRVDVDPFHGFHASIVQVSASADAALAVEQELVYERYLGKWAENREIAQLQLASGINVFEMALVAEPLYQEIQTARANLGKLNALAVQYVETLMLLSGSGEAAVSIDIEESANAIRTQASTLAESLELDVELDDGWFFGFAALAERYVESKRKDLLVELISSSQDEIVAFSQAGQQISQISALGIQAEYNNSFSALTENARTLSDSAFRNLVEEVISLNSQTLRQLETLRLIHATYGALPGAHLTLRQAVVDSNSYTLTGLLEYAESLKKKYDNFAEE